MQSSISQDPIIFGVRVSPINAHVLVISGLLAVALAGCGGGSKPSTTRTVTAPAPSGPSSTVTAGPVHATLTAGSHTPSANKLFYYSVRVTDASGRPLDGTVDTEFAFSGVVVGRETPPTHRLKNGALRDGVTFPKQSVGQPLELQTVIHTSRGSVTLDWPVTAKP